ncbi:MAG: hypothetical protein WDM77_07565, partial [Steroidobacteraceae bacterium]
MMDIVSRKDARARGLKRYFTGVPCLHGHIAERFVSRMTCVTCNSAYSAAWQKANPRPVVRRAPRPQVTKTSRAEGRQR